MKEGKTLKKTEKTGLCLALPALLGLMIFYIIPIGISGYNSLTFGGEFVGLENYRLTFDNYMFRLAVKNTFLFLGVSIPLNLLFSLGAALLLERNFVGNRFFRMAFLYPYVVPVAATVMTVKIFISDTGVLNTFLEQKDLPTQDWTRSSWAFLILVLLYLWKNMGYSMILLLSGLVMIPPEYEQMGRLDGCGKWNFFFYIKLPLLRQMLFFTALIALLNAFKCFRESFLIAGVHPHESIYMIQHFINNNINNLNYVKISTTAFTLFVLMFFLIALVYTKKPDKAG